MTEGGLVRGAWRWKLLTAGGLLCVVAMFASFGRGMWFQGRKHTRSGVPGNHWAARDGDRYYHVHRGGGPVEERIQYPMTAEQFQAYEQDGATGENLMALAPAFLLAGIFLGIAADRVRDGQNRFPLASAVN